MAYSTSKQLIQELFACSECDSGNYGQKTEWFKFRTYHTPANFPLSLAFRVMGIKVYETSVVIESDYKEP